MNQSPNQGPAWRERSKAELAAERVRVRERVTELVRQYKELDERVAREKDPGRMGDLVRAVRKARTALLLAIAAATGVGTMGYGAYEIWDFFQPAQTTDATPPSTPDIKPLGEAEEVIRWACKPTACEEHFPGEPIVVITPPADEPTDKK